MNIIFTPEGWEDYLFWQENNRKLFKKINELIKNIARTPFEGIGKPEPLKFYLTGCWSRRIDSEHRLVYRVEGENLFIFYCRYHYSDK